MLGALDQELGRLRKLGPVCAVLDCDKVQDLRLAGQRLPTCFSGIRKALDNHARRSDYGLVLLDQNVETLVTACCRAIGTTAPDSKPSPDHRDRILGKTAWNPGSNARQFARDNVPSFNRLVQWVVEKMPRALRTWLATDRNHEGFAGRIFVHHGRNLVRGCEVRRCFP